MFTGQQLVSRYFFHRYFKPAPCGSDIVVHAQTLRVGQKLAFLTVDITNKADGSLIAQGTHTKYVGQPKS